MTDPDLRKVFREKLFRQAISQAIDRKRVIKEVLKELGEPWFSTVNRLSPYYEPNIPKYDFDLKAAAEKLDRLGLKDTDRDGIRNLTPGKQLEFELITRASEDHGRRAAHCVAVEPQGDLSDSRSAGEHRGVYGQRLRRARVYGCHL